MVLSGNNNLSISACDVAFMPSGGCASKLNSPGFRIFLFPSDFWFRISSFELLLYLPRSKRYRIAMIPNEDAVAGLREALRGSPDNLPIRIALAEMLMGLGRYEEAETEYRVAMG